jgi:hypothetical protein
VKIKQTKDQIYEKNIYVQLTSLVQFASFYKTPDSRRKEKSAVFGK